MQLCHKFIRDGLNQFWLHASSLDKMATAGEHRLHANTEGRGPSQSCLVMSQLGHVTTHLPLQADPASRFLCLSPQRLIPLHTLKELVSALGMLYMLHTHIYMLLDNTIP